MSFTLTCPGVDLSQPPRTLAGSQLEFELFLPGPRWAGCPRKGGLLPRRPHVPPLAPFKERPGPPWWHGQAGCKGANALF